MTSITSPSPFESETGLNNSRSETQTPKKPRVICKACCCAVLQKEQCGFFPAFNFRSWTSCLLSGSQPEKPTVAAKRHVIHLGGIGIPQMYKDNSEIHPTYPPPIKCGWDVHYKWRFRAREIPYQWWISCENPLRL